ncbi:iron-containing alcohol dehydrogenase [Taklimakanibacter albus]|uniref:Iron-containing alcohol dehydrogenase n=1 Tax=Taklimakanibacter albus TaxID=2800327 RepID=A0ACC5R5U6_9HYPH|nr:iron-containing alcohol dehydrogenase [Aestuariivirga sp. YIM B02566]MBK1868032.1 iron-containing alcohol dehydrogenase [Aestuariivirga sp. YIM B02566]
MTIPNRNINFPTAIKFGAGRVKELAELCQANGIKRPLFVTDPGLAQMPMAAAILADLKKAGLGVALFSDVRPNPVEANLQAGIKAFKAGKHDGVIAFGGGSGLDIGKLIALMHGQKISVFDLEDIGDWWTRADAAKIVPIIAVPTTAGTGSEVGRAGVVTHPETHEKKIIFHPAIMPKVALLDPELSVGLPPKLTAATGMDALAHCLESYCAPFYHPLAKGVALEGMLLIKENLAKAVKKGADIDARGNMLVASSMGATAFQRGLGAIHALSHPFGGLYDAHHGLLNGIVMPYVLKANRKKIEKDIERAAAYLGIKGGFNGFLKWILALRKEVGIPHKLADIGIDTKRLDEVAKMAIKDPSAGGNPIQFSEKQYKALAKKCVTGDL